MLRSYVSYAAKGRIILRKEILEQLGIGPNGLLYGALCCDEKSLILSPIPEEYWTKAFKIIIHTKQYPGSLAKTAGEIAKLGFSTISSWASTESAEGHLSATFIVVPNESSLSKTITLDKLQDELINKIAERLSDLPQYKELISPVRLTPLSILNVYGRRMKEKKAVFAKIHVDQHTLRLDELINKITRMKSCLWSQLIEASQKGDSSLCILTPDTEEALLRIVAIPQCSKLITISFEISIKSPQASFAGYWNHALSFIAAKEYSIYSAQNLIISKSISPPQEKAEFKFLIDLAKSQDIGKSLSGLSGELVEEFRQSFSELKQKKGDCININVFRVHKPSGIGIPCFFATNAQKGDISGLKTTISLCRILEAYGFRPVNIDISRGGGSLRMEVEELIRACKFMVVLHCRNESLRRSDRNYDCSRWVLFEDWCMMQKPNCDIFRMSFSGVEIAGPMQGIVHHKIPNDGLDNLNEELFKGQLNRWIRSSINSQSDRLRAPDISDKVWNRDLISYYEMLLETELKSGKDVKIPQ